jgi:hypothetical protein
MNDYQVGEQCVARGVACTMPAIAYASPSPPFPILPTYIMPPHTIYPFLFVSVRPFSLLSFPSTFSHLFPLSSYISSLLLSNLLSSPYLPHIEYFCLLFIPISRATSNLASNIVHAYRKYISNMLKWCVDNI